MSRLPPLRSRPPGGLFRRLIDLRRADAHAAWGWVEDDFHHFGVRIEHAAGVITAVSVATKRAPWSTCAAADLHLQALKGQALRGRASDVGAMIDMRFQCTHMFDLAGLVMAQAFWARPPRLYEIEIPDRQPGFKDARAVQLGATVVRLEINGAPAMHWNLEDDMIVGPERYAGHSLNEGFRAWTEQMPEEEAEQAFVLRRAIMVSSGRFIDLDHATSAEDSPLPPVCHTYRGDLSLALRTENGTRDYSPSAQGMLAFRDTSP